MVSPAEYASAPRIGKIGQARPLVRVESSARRKLARTWPAVTGRPGLEFRVGPQVECVMQTGAHDATSPPVCPVHQTSLTLWSNSAKLQHLNDAVNHGTDPSRGRLICLIL